MSAVLTPTQARLQFKANGYSVIPVNGKAPVVENWTELGAASEDDIRSWERLRVNNTGVLTADTPCLDLDLFDAATIDAMVEHVREHFLEYGEVLARTGQPPKCCIPFRTDIPFKKITRYFKHGNDAKLQRIEFLGDGQQFVADGIHPDTHGPYQWLAGKDLTTVKHKDLPYINAEMAELLVDRLADIAFAHGYRLTDSRGNEPAGPAGGPPVCAPRRQANGGDRAYAEAALRQECDALAHMPKDSGRNNALNNASLKLHQLVAAGALTEQEVEAALIQACHGNGLVKDDGIRAVNKTIASGRKAGLAQPRKIPEPHESEPDYGPTPQHQKGQQQPEQDIAPRSISEVKEVFDKWLKLADFTPVYAVLGAVAANLLPGDPVWLGVVGPPSSAKTEILNATARLPNVVSTATVTAAGLLSGTPKKQKERGAKGGLLRQIGEFGIIALKDFGSILNMRPDSKAETLAALREVYDGAWTRHLGTDGGKTLSWCGKVGLVFASTGVIDNHYSVIGAMGDRFLLNRLKPAKSGQFQRALGHVGGETRRMRQELAEAVAGLFAQRRQPQAISNHEIETIDRTISLVVRLRGAVERDRHSHVLEIVYGEEGTARIGLCLERLLAGLDSLGVDRKTALDVVTTVAVDSVPPIRRRAYEFIAGFAGASTTTTAVAKKLRLPTVTVRRALEDLTAYCLITRKSQGKGKPDLWTLAEESEVDADENWDSADDA